MVGTVLRHFVNVGRAGTVGDVVEARVARLRQRSPVVFGAGIAIAPVGVEAVLARIAAVIRSDEKDNYGVVGQSVADDARNFGGVGIALISRMFEPVLVIETTTRTGETIG